MPGQLRSLFSRNTPMDHNDMTTTICGTGLVHDAEFGVSLPHDWTKWPTRIELAFTLTTGGAVTSEDYSKFRVISLHEAARNLFNRRYSRRLLRYSLKADGFLPAYRYDAEWSLLRRGTTGGVRRRRPEQRTEPWVHGADTTLLEIWRQPLTQYTFESRIWLRAGGRSEKDAIRNWAAAARCSCDGNIDRGKIPKAICSASD